MRTWLMMGGLLVPFQHTLPNDSAQRVRGAPAGPKWRPAVQRVGTALAGAALWLGANTAFAAGDAIVGQPAPDFTLTDTAGKEQTLSEARGSFVVLEWTNAECPFVRKHYGSGNMQQLQDAYTGKGMVWFTIVSPSPGKQGFIEAEEANALIAQRGDRQTAMLLDPDGAVGRLYGAKTTPHMFVINPEGQLVYAGGIDDRPTPDPDDIPGATNYVRQALDEAMAGQAVSVPETRSYGCSVKY